jgi:hypothetical protein
MLIGATVCFGGPSVAHIAKPNKRATAPKRKTNPFMAMLKKWTGSNEEMLAKYCAKFVKRPASLNRPIATFSRLRELDHNVSLSPVGECRLRRAQAMTKSAKRIPRWLTIDLTILVIGAVIMIISALWLGTNIQHIGATPS